MLLSFIILSYNQREQVKKCINSIKYSSIPKNKYEIIIIDDGSSDSSIEYLKSSENTVLIQMRKNTRNQSLLRNIGIGIAKGEYLMFADGDDYYNSIELGKIFKEIEKNKFDLLMTSMIHRYVEDNNLFYSDNKGDEFDHGTQIYVANRDFIIDNNLWFDEVKYNWDSEDMYFTYRLFDKADKIIYKKGNDFNYIHLMYDGNNTYDKQRKSTYLDYINELYNDLLLEIKNDKVKDLLDNYMIKEIGRIFKVNNNVVL